MRILITGSRTWQNEALLTQAIWNYLDEQHGPNREFNGLMIVHGACRIGADEIADRFAKERGIMIRRYAAEWDTLGRKAGLMRNTAMVQLSAANVCLAFINPCMKMGCDPAPHDSHGAHDCVQKAVAHDIPTRVYREGFPEDYRPLTGPRRVGPGAGWSTV